MSDERNSRKWFQWRSSWKEESGEPGNVGKALFLAWWWRPGLQGCSLSNNSLSSSACLLTVPEISESGKHWFSTSAEAEAGRAACWANWMHLTSPELLERRLTWVSLKHWATKRVCSFLPCHSKKDLQQIIKQNTVENETQHNQLLEGAESWMVPGEPWFVKRDAICPHPGGWKE